MLSTKEVQRPKKRERGKKVKGDVPSCTHNYKAPCIVCGELPTVADTDLCGPCCFGEAATYGGNW